MQIYAIYLFIFVWEVSEATFLIIEYRNWFYANLCNLFIGDTYNTNNTFISKHSYGIWEVSEAIFFILGYRDGFLCKFMQFIYW